MNFELSYEQRDIQRAALEFAEGEFDPNLCLELDQSAQFPEAIWKKASRLGFIGIHYPEEFGGQGLGLLENVLIIEAFCKVDSGIGSSLSIVDIGAEVILEFGSEEQKKQLLAPLTKGEKRMSIAFAESEDGRDLSSVSTTAERSSKGYLIRGGKRFVLNAPLADSFLILCKEPIQGWITLIVERKMDGIEVVPIEMMGLRMIPFGDLHFKEVLVSLESRVGHDGEGMAHVNHCHEMMGLRSTAQALGTYQGAFDRAIQYARQREQFGRKLSQFQIIRHKLADIAVSIEVGRCLTYKAAAEFDQGRIDLGSFPIARLEIGRRLVGVIDEALQIFGGYGYIVEEAIEHYFRDAWAIEVGLGAQEELKDVIAERILGTTSLK